MTFTPCKTLSEQPC